MTNSSDAIYLWNTDCEYCDFTVGKAYTVNHFDIADENYFWCSDDNGVYRYIKNGAFHTFAIREENGDIKLKIPDEFIGKEKQFKYYINGEAVSKVKFDDTLLCVKDFKSDGIDTSSIKFEVKFE